MKAWNSLMDSALIGTDKKGLEISVILPAIADVLTGDTASQRLLDAASLTHFYSKGAVQALTAPINSAIEISETQPVTTAEQQALLQDILFVEYDWAADLLARWIDRVAVQGYRVNPVQLTRLLQRAEQGQLTIAKEQLPVLGTIGKYVAQRFGLMHADVFLSEGEYLLQASPAEMKNYLYRLRKQDRGAFVNCLHQHWGLFSLNDQLDWTRLMRDMPSEAEIAFARQLWENDFPPKAKETANYTRIRTCLAAMLLSQRTASFYRETLEALQQYCAKQPKGFFSKLLKSGPEKSIAIPAAEDTFLNETVFHERFGLLVDNPIKQVTEERLQAYFRHLVAILPFQTWATLLECTSEQAFSYFKADPAWQRLSGGQNVWELADAFQEISAFTDDETFLLLYGLMPENLNYKTLLRLPPDSLEKVVLSRQSDIDLHNLTTLFYAWEGADFSPALATYVLKKSWQHYQLTHFYKPAGLERLLPLMPVAALPELEKLIYDTGDSPGKTEWLQDIGISLHAYLKLKQRTEKPDL